MSNQFVHLNSPQGNGHQEKQPSLGLGDGDDPSSVPGNQSQGGFPRLIPQRPGSTGLLSNWKAGQLQHPSVAGIPSLISVTEQETVEHAAVGIGGSATGLALYRGNPPVQMYMSGPVSPHQSSVTPLAAVQTPPQPLPPPAYMPRPGSPPLTMGQSFSQPFVPMMPMSMPAPPASPAPPRGYQSAPPFLTPPIQGGQGPKGNRRKKRRFPIWARVVLSVLLVILIAVGSLASYYYLTFSAPVSRIIGQPVPRSKGEGDPNQGRTGDVLSGKRINILLLGSDTDEKFTAPDGSHHYLAQTDIVVTIDPTTKAVAMLSIPRDFWLNVPGYGMHKLDQAYGLGSPDPGMSGNVGLSRLTIEQAFGIPINYYAWVGLDGFVKVIDTVGGVDVDAIHPITDDLYPDDVGNHTGDIYAVKRLYIAPGPQHLSGPEALEYVRSRHADLVGDFGRSARQQQVLNQLKTKLNNATVIGELPSLAHDLDGWVKTDMQLDDVFKLMNFARSLDTNKVNRVILGPPYSSIGNAPDGESVVFPDCSKIVPVIAKMFALGSKAVCNIQANSNNAVLASTSQTSSSSNAITQIATNGGWQIASQMTSTSAMSLNSGGNDFLGIHSLLDLLFLVVFDSPQALHV